ncbi:hypothetical protein U9M48_003961 [Paspalum notatum var. saurae]|uniref:Uncharacterized protein n=1 Tax=Paspalum notatum var. saurae TaxID=547442 RepID=A0AAQ3PS84_PASNO
MDLGVLSPAALPAELLHIWPSVEMASASVALSGCKNNGSASIGAEKLQDWMNKLKIRDDKEAEATIIMGKAQKLGT